MEKLTILLTILLSTSIINVVFACSYSFPGPTTDNYCFPGGYLKSNSTGVLERKAVCSVSETAIDAQIELAQRYRNGYYLKPESKPKSHNSFFNSFFNYSPCPDLFKQEPEEEIYKNQIMADYWDKFASITKTILMAKNGDKYEQLRLAKIYLDNGKEFEMIDLFREIITPVTIKQLSTPSFNPAHPTKKQFTSLESYLSKLRELKSRYWLYKSGLRFPVRNKVAVDLTFSSPEKCSNILNTRLNKEISNDLAEKYGECIKSHFPKKALQSYYAAQVEVHPSGYITMNRKDGGLTHDARDFETSTISWHASPEDVYSVIHADVIRLKR